MEKIYIIIHFTLCFFVDLENFGHEKEAEEEMEEEEEEKEEEEKADAAVDDATLEDVVEFTEDTGPRSGTLMNTSKKKFQTRFSLNFAQTFSVANYTQFLSMILIMRKLHSTPIPD
jgi:hypothetical protein